MDFMVFSTHYSLGQKATEKVDHKKDLDLC